MTQRTTVRLPDDLLRRAKRRAAADGRTLTALIEDGLRLVVNSKRNREKRKRAPLPISKATGGPMPGFEEISFSKIQQLDDLEYVERMKHLK